jgi:vancomycin resistance protein VanW
LVTDAGRSAFNQGRRAVLLSERYTAVYAASVAGHRALRRAEWLADRSAHAERSPWPATPFRVASHSSILLRRLAGVDMELQRNKVHNLRLAAVELDGRILRPGQRLSFWRAIGSPNARRGYLPGLVLIGGSFAASTGGGLCQLSNLLYWLALHTPLEVVERHHHGYDVFPDSGRVLPFGSGATVFYNYVDLVLRNPTALTFRLQVDVGPSELQGAFWSDTAPPLAYHVRETGHRFFQMNGKVYRENRLHQVAIDRATGAGVSTEEIAHNVFPVMYEVPAAALDAG